MGVMSDLYLDRWTVGKFSASHVPKHRMRKTTILAWKVHSLTLPFQVLYMVADASRTNPFQAVSGFMESLPGNILETLGTECNLQTDALFTSADYWKHAAYIISIQHFLHFLSFERSFIMSQRSQHLN